MRILYAIQGTGNGHICRAMEILPELIKYADVDVLISGIQNDLELPCPVKFRLKGLSFIFGQKGGIDYWETWSRNSLRSIIKEVYKVPIKDYDLVLNDFEPISAWASKLKGIPSISVSHQSALLSPFSPKPLHKDLLGKLILKYYAPSAAQIGVHFQKYDPNLFYPIIRKEVRKIRKGNSGHITIYLPAYSDKSLISIFSHFPETEWEIFSKHAISSYTVNNIKISTLGSKTFIESMANSSGVICGAGFETPSEALYLSKKLMVVPMKGQYEQHFNAEALKTLGVKSIPFLSLDCLDEIHEWLHNAVPIEIYFPDETDQLVMQIFSLYSRFVSEPVKSAFQNSYDLWPINVQA